MSLAVPAASIMPASLAAVASKGAALRNATRPPANRRSVVPFIVEFEDAMLSEMRRHSQSANWAKDSYVKFYVNVHMDDTQIASSIWNFTIQALEKSMQRVMLINPGVPKAQIFGELDIGDLRQLL